MISERIIVVCSLGYHQNIDVIAYYCLHHNCFTRFLVIFNVNIQSENEHQSIQITHQIKVKDFLVICMMS